MHANVKNIAENIKSLKLANKPQNYNRFHIK